MVHHREHLVEHAALGTDAVLEEVSAAGSDFGAVFLVAITFKLSTQLHVDA
jgi:hypothetical protein